jgi:hypothetical protein
VDLLTWTNLLISWRSIVNVWDRWSLRCLSRGVFRWRYKSLKLWLLVWCSSLDSRLLLFELLVRSHSSSIIAKGAPVRRNLQTIVLLTFKHKWSRYFWIFRCLLLLLPTLSLELKRKGECRWKLSFHALHRGYWPLWFNLNRCCLSFILLLQGIVNWAKVNKLLTET